MLELLIEDHGFWRFWIRPFVLQTAKNWPEPESDWLVFLYRNLCCQFYCVLEKWKESDFDKKYLTPSVHLILSWLEADGLLPGLLEPVRPSIRETTSRKLHILPIPASSQLFLYTSPHKNSSQAVKKMIR